MSASNGRHYVVEATEGITIPRPADWTRKDAKGTGMVLLAPRVRGVFRPNVVVTGRPFDGSIAKLSTFLMAAALKELTSPHLIACNIWPHPAGDGRQIEYTHESDNLVLHAQRWAFAVGGRAVEVTATCGSTQLTAIDELFGYLAANIELRKAA